MSKITNDVLAEKIDNLHATFKEIKPDIKENTKFRLEAKGALGVLTFSAGVIGGFIVFVLDKIFTKRP